MGQSFQGRTDWGEYRDADGHSDSGWLIGIRNIFTNFTHQAQTIHSDLLAVKQSLEHDIFIKTNSLVIDRWRRKEDCKYFEIFSGRNVSRSARSSLSTSGAGARSAQRIFWRKYFKIFSELQHLQDLPLLQVPHLQAGQGWGQETLEECSSIEIF